MKSTEEALQELREKKTQLEDEFNRIMGLKKILSGQMTRDRTFEELYHLDMMSSCYQALALEVLKKLKDVEAEMKMYIEKMMEEP